MKSFFLAPIRNFSLELFRTTYYIYCIAGEKCEKECNMREIILVQGFCPVKIEITQFPIGFHLTPVIAFVHFLLGAGEGVLAAGEWVVCQDFFFLLFLKVYELIYDQHSLCFTGWWQWRNSGFKWNGQQDVPILCLSHSYLKNPQWCHIKVCHRGMKCSL